MDYRLEGRKIVSERGRIVATLNEEGQPVMEPGMAGPHTKGVREFLEILGDNEGRNPEQDTKDEQEPEQHKEPEQHEEADHNWMIETIPDSMLPPFSKQLGEYTPGFAEYVEKHKLTPMQKMALVERLNK